MDKRFLAILAAIVIVLGGFFVITKRDSDSGSNTANTEPTNHTIGEGQAGVTILEYGDFQCPVCAIYASPIKQAVNKYQNEVKFQYRHLPLISIHPNAFAAARAAEAASKQGKFWEMHDKLFQNQSAWASSSSPLSLFKTYAQELQLNAEQFDTDFASQEVNDLINADISAFGQTGQQQSTPSFFINGEPVSNSEFANPETGAPDVDAISVAIDAVISKQTQ